MNVIHRYRAFNQEVYAQNHQVKAMIHAKIVQMFEIPRNFREDLLTKQYDFDCNKKKKATSTVELE